MKKIVITVVGAILVATVLGAYARMEQVQDNSTDIGHLKKEVLEVKEEVRGLKDAVEKGNKQVVVEIRKLGKAMRGQAGEGQ